MKKLSEIISDDKMEAFLNGDNYYAPLIKDDNYNSDLDNLIEEINGKVKEVSN